MPPAIAISIGVFLLFTLIVLCVYTIRATKGIRLMAPIHVRAMEMCKTCHGRGREPLAVDPRSFPKTEDEKLKFEDFPQCRKCKGIGYTPYLVVEINPGRLELNSLASSDGAISPGSLTWQGSLRSALKPKDSPLDDSASPSEPSVSSPIVMNSKIGSDDSVAQSPAK
jgi:hypothetical protein